MKSLLILWDPRNPIAPASPLVEALREHPGLSALELTFDELGHQTLPNRAFSLPESIQRNPPDSLLWIEGGPLPTALDHLECPKACWLINSHLEPKLLEAVDPDFHHQFVTSMELAAGDRRQWLPLSAATCAAPVAPVGVSVLVDDPEPASHASVRQALRELRIKLPDPPVPIALCLGNAGQVHPMLFECLRSGAATIVDPESDLRGIAQSGVHLERFPSVGELPRFMESLISDRDRLQLLADRGRAIVDHLHRPTMRAERIYQTFWPQHRILSGKNCKPRVSVLVTCYRYLRRFKVCLESLARQRLPDGTLEIVVADPASPDGLADYLVEFGQRNPGLRLVHLPIDPLYRRNRGVGINRAFDASAGEVIISIDGDIIFPPGLIDVLWAHVADHPEFVFGVRRTFLPKELTEEILSGATDPFVRFSELAKSDGDGEENPFVGVLGYCQAVHRSGFSVARYPEEFDQVNQSDIVFIQRLTNQAGVQPRFLSDHHVLHLWHPRNWMGTNENL